MQNQVSVSVERSQVCYGSLTLVKKRFTKTSRSQIPKFKYSHFLTFSFGDHFLERFFHNNRRNNQFQVLRKLELLVPPSVPAQPNFQGDRSTGEESGVMAVLSPGPEQVLKGSFDSLKGSFEVCQMNL